jgi:formylglycine-generating enzyme required for sulfatase activity
MPTKRDNPRKPQSETEKKNSKLTSEVIIAIIGLIGTIITAILAPIIIERWNSNKETPTATIAESAISQVTDTATVAVPTFSPLVSPGDVVDAKGVVMVHVPAGKFTMGSDMEDDEKPPHEVYLDAYYIDKYEVTNALYKTCVDTSICKLPIDVRHYNDPLYANHPVVYVDWQMSQNFCEWRGARLPTEAEWEKAARGTDNRLYPWGDTANCEQANYANCIGDTTEVGKYKSGASPYGAYDMAGNVWEYVADWYLSDYYQIIESNLFNPQGPNSGDRHVIRGGDWESTTSIRSAYRGSFHTVYGDLGFRCAYPESISATATATFTAIAEGQELPNDIVDSKRVLMALVPSGEFTMGADNGDADEQPAHRVYLDAFYIDKYEVTNGLYKACIDAKVCDPPYSTGSSTRDNYFGNSAFNNYPVISVDWYMAKNFCEWRAARLPTEAEWEKAARGTNQPTYPWGDTLNKAFANYNLNIGDTTAVGSYEDGKSFYGVYDMAGNVYEWVADWYAGGYYKASQFENPIGPELGKSRMDRGGSWNSTSEYVTVFNRSYNDPTKPFSDVGFRCAKDANP